MAKWLLLIAITVVGGVVYSAFSAVTFFRGLESTSTSVLQAEAPKDVKDPASLNYAFQAIVAQGERENSAAPAPESPKAPALGIGDIRARMRSLAPNGAFIAKRELLTELQTKYAINAPEECAEVAVEFLIAAAKIASNTAEVSDQLETRYGATDNAFFALHVLLATNLKPERITTLAIDAAKAANDRDIQLTIARNLIHKFPESQSAVFGEYQHLGITDKEILQLGEYQDEPLRQPAQEIE